MSASILQSMLCYSLIGCFFLLPVEHEILVCFIINGILDATIFQDSIVRKRQSPCSCRCHLIWNFRASRPDFLLTQIVVNQFVRSEVSDPLREVLILLFFRSILICDSAPSKSRDILLPPICTTSRYINKGKIREGMEKKKQCLTHHI